MKVVTIGRNSDNTIIVNDPYAGRHHCQITQNDNGTFCLLDRNAKNGTFVNGRRVSGEVMLNQSDVVRVGNTTLPWQSYFTGGGSSGTIINPSGGGGYMPPAPPLNKPDNFLVWSILGTIFCCLPFGIVAIVNSAKVDRLWYAGDHAGAERAAKSARTWFWWSFALGLVGGIITTIFYVVLGVGAAFL